MKRFRRANSYETCGDCMFYKSCRGCPAVTFGFTQNPFSDNPLCFKDLLTKEVKKQKWVSPAINTTKQEEADIVKSMLHNQYSADYAEFIEKEDVLVLIGTLLGSKGERRKFFKSDSMLEFMQRMLVKRNHTFAIT